MERERLKDQAAMEEGLVGAGSGESQEKGTGGMDEGRKPREHEGPRVSKGGTVERKGT